MSPRRFIGTVDDLAQVVRAERLARALSQADLARAAGVGRRFISDIENGHPRAELAKVLQVLEALDVHALALPSVPSGRRLEEIDLDDVLQRHV